MAVNPINPSTSYRRFSQIAWVWLAFLIGGGFTIAADSAVLDSPFRFEDRGRSSGLSGIYWKGAMRQGKIITSEGAGVGWGDFDGDGWLDLYLPQGVGGDSEGYCGHLYRNDGSGSFEDVTRRSRILSCRWGMGVLWVDLDHDSFLDLVLTNVGALEIWWNRGDGSFEEVDRGDLGSIDCWSTGITALDFDRDGDLDLFGSCYLETTSEEERDRSFMVAKGILDYEPGSEFLLRNEGARVFSDVTGEAGLKNHERGRGLTVVAADFDRDGWPDLYVANDRDANHLLHNQRDGTFEEVGILSGTSIGSEGGVQAGMGVAVGDLDGNGWPDLVVTNFAGEPANVYLNQGELVFQDESRRWGLDAVTRGWLGWSTEIVDLDNDGFLDLFVANAHLVPAWVSRVMGWIGQGDLVSDYFLGPYRQPFLLLRQNEGRFDSVGEIPGLVVRGASAADFDRDGNLDLFLFSSARPLPSLLLENTTQPSGAWLAIDHHSPGASSLHAGDEIEVSSGARRWIRQSTSGGSYLSGSARPIHIGVGERRRLDVEWRRWASRTRRIRGIPSDRFVVLMP